MPCCILRNMSFSLITPYFYKSEQERKREEGESPCPKIILWNLSKVCTPTAKIIFVCRFRDHSVYLHVNVTNTWSLTAVISNCHSNSLGPGSVVRRKSKKKRWNSTNRRAKWAEWGTGEGKRAAPPLHLPRLRLGSVGSPISSSPSTIFVSLLLPLRSLVPGYFKDLHSWNVFDQHFPLTMS